MGDPKVGASSATVPRFQGAKILEGAPELIGSEALSVRLSEDRVIEVEWDKVQALSAVGVLGMGDGPVVLIDLILNWNDEGGCPLQLVRLRGDRFDPRRLVGDGVRLAEAYRAFLSELHANTGAVPLPDPEAARGRPIRVFESLDAYQRKVLDVEGSS
jgi:hypothetical protein